MRKAILKYLLPDLAAREFRQGVLRTRATQEAYTDCWDKAYARSQDSIASVKDDDLARAEEFASNAFEAELGRKDALEAKAATFVSSPTIATVVTIAAAATGWTRQSGWMTVLLVALHALALTFLILSTHYAVAARAAEPFVVPNAQNAALLSTSTPRERVARLLAYARMNEPLLLIKVNHLFLAQMYFVRGLFAIALVVLVMAVRWVSQGTS